MQLIEKQYLVNLKKLKITAYVQNYDILAFSLKCPVFKKNILAPEHFTTFNHIDFTLNHE